MQDTIFGSVRCISFVISPEINRVKSTGKPLKSDDQYCMGPY